MKTKPKLGCPFDRVLTTVKFWEIMIYSLNKVYYSVMGHSIDIYDMFTL